MSPADAALLFDGARLTLARQLAGLRKSDLATEIHKSPTAVAGWESGKRPSATTVAQLAVRFGVEPSFFAETNGGLVQPSSEPHFRSLRSTTQLARDQASAFGKLAVDIAAGLELHVEFPRCDLDSAVLDDAAGLDPEGAAQLVRASWQLPEGPVRHLLRITEHHGVLVVFTLPQAATVDAYSFASPARPVIVLNPLKHDYYRQRFDLAHELGHLVMHRDADPGGRVVEQEAHQFASELLMPAAELRPVMPRAMNATAWRTLARLKEQWGVSIQALLFRARHLGVLSDVSYRNAMMTVSARGWRRHEPGQRQVLEQPSLLPRAVEVLASEGIDEVQLAAQCRAPLELFRAITSRTPRQAEPPQQPESERMDGSASVVSLFPDDTDQLDGRTVDSNHAGR